MRVLFTVTVALTMTMGLALAVVSTEVTMCLSHVSEAGFVQATTTCDCYCSPALPTTVPFPFAGSFTANSCFECQTTECQSRFPTVCRPSSSCDTCGVEARCGDAFYGCSATTLPTPPALSSGWQISAMRSDFQNPSGAVALLKCAAGTDARFAQGIFGSLYLTTCSYNNWFPRPQNIQPSCDGGIPRHHVLALTLLLSEQPVTPTRSILRPRLIVMHANGAPIGGGLNPPVTLLYVQLPDCSSGDFRPTRLRVRSRLPSRPDLYWQML